MGALVVVLTLICLLVSCQNRKQAPIESKQTTDQIQAVEQAKDKEQEFKGLKESGLEAMKSDKLTTAIDNFTKALAFQLDDEIKTWLDDCYRERGEYFYSIDKLDEALDDLGKCDSTNPKTLNLLVLIDAKKEPILQKPANQEKLESTNITFVWEAKLQASSYEIQIEDQNWNTVLVKKVTTSSLVLTNEIKFDTVYYWRVRTFYANNKWGVWSKKSWFSVRKAIAQIPSPSKLAPELVGPPANGKLTLTDFFFTWYAVEGADSYEIEVQDRNWKIIISTTTKEDKYQTSNELNMNELYYWRVRAHFPDKSWGEWSEKRWFNISTESSNSTDLVSFKNELKKIIELGEGLIVSITPLYPEKDWEFVKVVVSDAWYVAEKYEKDRFANEISKTINSIAGRYGINKGSVSVIYYDSYDVRVAEPNAWSGGYKILK